MNKKKLRQILLESSTSVLIIIAEFFNLLLPFRVQLKIWRSVGILLYYLNRHYRRICLINLSRCFPEKTEAEIKILCKKTFYSMGMGIAETLAAWQMSDRRFQKIKIVMHGLEEIKALQANKKNILVYFAHYCSMEFCGRKALRELNATALYKKTTNFTLDRYMLAQRTRNYQCMENRNVRQLLEFLKQEGALFYLPDQNVSRNANPIFENFFNIPCSMSEAVERLPKITGATCVFCYCYRDFSSLTYHIHFQVINEPMTAAVYNRLLEQAIRRHPEQYFWIHRRFKTRPQGDMAAFYH